MIEEFLQTKNLKVVKEKVLVNEFDSLPNGIREFVVQGSIRDINKLPHILDCPLHNFQTLIRIPGRPPMCLKCHQLGHLRYQCTAGRQQQGPPRRDPSNPWGSRPHHDAPAPSDIDSDSETNDHGNKTIINSQESESLQTDITQGNTDVIRENVDNDENGNNAEMNRNVVEDRVNVENGNNIENRDRDDIDDESRVDNDAEVNNENTDSVERNNDNGESDDERDKYNDADTDDEYIRSTQENYHKSDKVAAQRKSERKAKKKSKTK